jgi:hypothetical protein
LNTRVTCDQILEHVANRPLHKTGGCFNLLALEIEEANLNKSSPESAASSSGPSNPAPNETLGKKSGKPESLFTVSVGSRHQNSFNEVRGKWIKKKGFPC